MLDSSESGQERNVTMINQKTLNTSVYAQYINNLGDILKLSRDEVTKRYKNYPLCLTQYIEKNKHEFITEIRFDEDEITISCVFNADGQCTSASLFPYNNQVIEELVCYINILHPFDYIKKRWTTSHYYIKVKELECDEHYLCLFFYHKYYKPVGNQ